MPVDPAILRAKVSAYVDLFAKTRALEQAVSHAKALNEEFRDSEVRTRAVLEHVADGIVTVTSAGMVETVNRAAVEMFGYDEDEVIGKSFALMIDFELSPESSDELTIQELLAQHVGGDRTVEWFGRRKGGCDVSDELRPERRAARRPARCTSPACATSRSSRRTPRRCGTGRCTTSSRDSRIACCSPTARIRRSARRPAAGSRSR